MDNIRCGEPDCSEMATPETVVEMANLTGGMTGGLFPHSRDYKCPNGHVTTLQTVVDELKAALHVKQNGSERDAPLE
jgi:hypothetical protein